ncbi:MAG: hypothetical protein QGH66_04405, partial [Dehalococcoidia bacterium]|nr:hypothetical protein [Dehalococcoidia bacterium]
MASPCCEREVLSTQEDHLKTMRHSASHLMAGVVQELFPEARFAIGPPIEDGFYYDFAYDPGFTEANLATIQAKMEELARADLPVARQT